VIVMRDWDKERLNCLEEQWFARGLIGKRGNELNFGRIAVATGLARLD
jgi:hypothetical protein